MSYDNSPLLVERNERGFWCRTEHVDEAKSVLGLMQVLAHDSTARNLTGTGAETTFYSVTLPGGILGPTGLLRVSLLASCTGSVAGKTLRIRIDGASVYALDNAGSAANVSMAPIYSLRNRGDEASQVASPSYSSGVGGGVTAAVQTLAIDTSTDKVISITGTLVTPAEFLRLESVLIEVLPS